MEKFKEQLINYQPKGVQESAFKEKMLSLLAEKKETAFLRSALEAHFTASAWLLDLKNEKVLLLKHAKLNKWLQPGGHADGEADLKKAAIKEALEETNLNNLFSLEDGIFDIDIHAIPQIQEVKGHEHFDVRYIFEVTDPKATKINKESKDFKWFSLEEIVNLTSSPSILRMVDKTKKYFTSYAS